MTASDPHDLYCPVPKSRFEPLFSRRIGSLRFIFWFVAVVTVVTVAAFLLLWVNIGSDFFEKDQLGRSLVGPAVALFGTGLAALLKLYDLSKERLGAIDTFLQEMIGICRLIYSTKLVVAYQTLYFMPEMGVFKDIQKSENYTISYDNNIKDLGFLGPNELSCIVTFYTMIKGSRDLIENFKNWPELDARLSEIPLDFIEQRKRWDVTSLIYCLFVAFESVYYAVGYLSQNEQQKQHYQEFIMTEMCDCYVFLIDTMLAEDPRSKWLKNKRRTQDIVREKKKVYEQSQNAYDQMKSVFKAKYPYHYHDTT